MSLILYHGKAQYLAGDRRFRYLSDYYFEDTFEKVFLNESGSIAYAAVGRLPSEGDKILLDIAVKKYLVNERTEETLKQLYKELDEAGLNRLSVDENDSTVLLMTDTETFKLECTANVFTLTPLLKNLSTFSGNGLLAAKVCLLAKQEDPKIIFHAVSLSCMDVSRAFDVIYRQDLKPLKKMKRKRHG